MFENGSVLVEVLPFLRLCDVFHFALSNSRLFLAVLQKARRLPLCHTVVVSQLLVNAMQMRSTFTERLLRSVRSVVSTRELLTASILTRLGMESGKIERLQAHRLSADAAINCFSASLFPSLTHLHLGGIAYACGGLSDLSIRNMLSGIGQQLESFKLIKLPDITALAFDCISFFCSLRLKELRIISCIGFLNSFRVAQLKQFITKCGANLTIFDIRYSIEVNDEFLHTLRVTKLNHLQVFLGSRSKLYESLVHSESRQKLQQLHALKVIPILSAFVWESFQSAYSSASLLYIDDISAEAYGANKPRFIARRHVTDTEEEQLVDGLPLPAQLLLTKAQSSSSQKRPTSPLPFSEELLCDECIPFLHHLNLMGQMDCHFACKPNPDPYATWIHYDDESNNE